MIAGRKDPTPSNKRTAMGEARKLFDYIEVDEFLLSPTFQRWIIAIVVSLLLALLFVRPYAESMTKVKYRVGEVAIEDIYAPENMQIRDDEATRGMIDAAVAAEPPVFNYDSAVQKAIEARLRKSFADFRALYRPEQDWNDAEKRRMDVLRRELKQRGGRTVPYVFEDNYADREKALKIAFADVLKDLSPNQFIFNDKLFAALKQDRFSEATEDKVIELYDMAMTDGVIEKKAYLELARGKGIVVMESRIGETAPVEYRRSDVGTIRDVPGAKKRLTEISGDAWGRDVPKNMRGILVEIAEQLITPNYAFDSAATQARLKALADSIEPVMVEVKRGEIIVRQGEVISHEMARKLKLIGGEESSLPLLTLFLGHFLWIIALLSALYTFPARTIRKFKPGVKDIATLSFLLLMTMVLQRVAAAVASKFGASPEFMEQYTVPFVAGVMIIRLLMNSEIAIVYAVALAGLAGSMSGRVETALFALVGGLLGANEVGHARNRTTIARAGLMTGLANVFMTVAFALEAGTFFEVSTAFNAAGALAGGILAGFFCLGLMPMIESLLGYVSDIRLLELASQEQPLLKKLIIEAPGTYQHSMMVGTLVEAAAEAIHVNPLLGKVMALYHDVGKMDKSHYFVENQRDGMNPHDKLNPSMSTLIISSHVKYGQELAKMYRLPQLIIDAIPQHHGTKLVQYFYARAKEREDPELEHVEEKDFRYPGPKPQTREAAILMMADGVEATARSMPDPTPARLKGMVKRIIGGIFNDGQLDECELTLKDLTAITDAFTDVLTSIYHSRPEYPTVPTSGGKTGGHHSGGKTNGDSHPPGGRESRDGPRRKAEDRGPAQKNTQRSPA